MAYTEIGSSNQLTIKSLAEPNVSNSFPAYLETSEVGYIIDSRELTYAPLSFINSKVHLRTRQKLSLKFNVFSTTTAESAQNYRKLDSIINSIKPVYTYMQGQYVPSAVNNTGLIAISFAGLPKTGASSTYGEDLHLHITNFAYSINKDMGYHSSSVSALTPVAYSLQIDGEILLEFNKTARITNSDTRPAEGVSPLGSRKDRADFIEVFNIFTGRGALDYDKLSDSQKTAVAGYLTTDFVSSYKSAEAKGTLYDNGNDSFYFKRSKPVQQGIIKALAGVK